MIKFYYSKRHEVSSVEEDKQGDPPLEQHIPLPTTDDCSTLLPCNNNNGKLLSAGGWCLENIEVGCLYELNHTKLPPKSPIQLKSVRAVMVTQKSQLNVTVRFPSTLSIRTYLKRLESSHQNETGNTNNQQQIMMKNNLISGTSMHPELDEEFVMASKLAAAVLVQQILPSDVAKHKHLESFWLPPPPPPPQEAVSCGGMGMISTSSSSPMVVAATERQFSCRRYDSKLMRMGMCWSELINSAGLVHWGVRKRVAFLGRQNNNKTPVVPVLEYHHQNQSSLTLVAAVREKEENEEEAEAERSLKDTINNEDAILMDEGMEMDQDKTIVEKTSTTSTGDHQTTRSSRRKRRLQLRDQSSSQLLLLRLNRSQSPDKAIRNKRKLGDDIDPADATGAGQKKKNKVAITSYDRWSKERYKTAEVKMLEIMKERGAVFGRPMLRRTLRAEARKHIGDTGLLDHLLKHMAGKVGPDGEVRFRRRHNADGEMEYWLERADLVNIRREAGVKDPFWTPPPGWMPGDNPSQDPICARDLRLLKQEMSTLKMNVEQIMTVQVQQQQQGGGGGGDGDEALINVTNITNPATVLVSASDNCRNKLDQLSQSSTSAATLIVVDDHHQLIKESYDSLMKRKAQLEQQLIEISNSLNGIQEDVRRLTSRVEKESTIAKSVPVVVVDQEEETNNKQQQQNEEKNRVGGNHSCKKGKGEEEEDEVDEATDEAVEVEEKEKETKAEKRQRLRSGFRICKPQGTFLWPNMAMAAAAAGTGSTTTCSNTMLSPNDPRQYQHQHRQAVVVPTPPSVSSATSAQQQQQHHHLLIQAPPPPPVPPHHDRQQQQPTSPVKPLAERRGVSVKTVSSSVNLNVLPVPPDQYSSCETTDHQRDYGDNISTTTTTSSLLHYHRLNDTNNRELCGTPTSAPQPQLQPRTLLLLPHVSCGKGGNDHQNKQEEAVVSCYGGGTNTNTNTTSSRTEQMMMQMYHQRKQNKQLLHDHELQLDHQEEEEEKYKEPAAEDDIDHHHHQFIKLL